MEDEGIMALPQGQEAMQNQDLPAITSMDSYDAATTALGRVNPEQLTAYKQAIREAIAGLELSPAEIETLLEIVEYMSQNPGEYPQLLRQLIDQDYIDEGDLPDQYDPVYLGVMLAALNELKLSMSEGAAAPMQMAPEVEGLGPLPMAEGGLADMARLLASQGRNGDTMLAHITPEEARLLKARGGAGTINPTTGLPEFFIKKLFKGIKKVFKAVGKAVKSALKNPIVRVIASVALATVLGPTGFAVMSAPAAAATASAATTLGAGGNLKDALIASATSYFGAGGTIPGTNINPAAAVASRVGQYLPGGAEGAIAKGIGSGVTSAGIGMLTGASPEEALRMGALSGLTTGATQAFQNWLAGQPQVEQPVQPQAPEVYGGGSDTPNPQAMRDVAGAPGVERALGELPPQDYLTTGTAPAASQVGAAAPGPIGTANMLRAPAGMRFDVATGQYVPSAVNQAMSASLDAAAQGGTPLSAFGRIGRAVSSPSFENIRDAFFINPNAEPGTLARFAPAALTTVGIGALTGGFKSQPVNENPLFNRQYTGLDYIRENPGMFSGSLGRIEGIPQSYNPVVPTPSYSTLPITTPPVVTPRGVTLQPAGVTQPYNVQGLYGVPQLAGPVQQPVYMANGGAVNDPTSADYWYEEFSRSNPSLSAEYLRKAAADRAAVFQEMRAQERPAQQAAPAQTAPAATSDPMARSADANYWYDRLIQMNPGIDPARARSVAEERAATFRGEVAPISGTPSAYVPSVLPSAAALAASRYGALPRFSSPAFDPQQFSAFNTLQNRFGQVPGAEGAETPFSNTPYAIPRIEMPRFFEKGGQATHFPRKTGPINGPGTGTSDSIPAMLSDGEFVFTAKAVRNAGGGSRRKGAKRMYALMKKLEGGPVKKGDA